MSRGDEDLFDLAGARRGDFDGGLVGFDFHNGLIFGDRISLADEHFEDIARLDAITQVRQFNVNTHRDCCFLPVERAVAPAIRP